MTLPEKFRAKRAAWDRRPNLLRTNHRMVLGDARRMPTLDDGTADETVGLVVTSPPYWNLKKYAGDSGDAQLGHVASREAFLNELDQVWSHCLRVLKPGGRLCVVVGDVCRSRKTYGRHFVEPLHAHVQVRCQALGFDPLAPILWHKITNGATEVAGNGNAFFGKPYEPNAVVKNDVEYVLIFRKPGYRKPTPLQRDLSMIDKEDHSMWFRQIWDDVPGQQRRDHPAPFPVEIARRLIGMFSFVGDTVLDPFLGTAATTRAAIRMNRSSVGVEVEPSYLSSAAAVLQEEAGEHDATVEVIQ